MNQRVEQAARFSLVNECFVQVSKNEFVKNKWITMNAWFGLIKKEMPNCALNYISLRWFTSYLLKSGKVSQNSNFPSPSGCYLRQQKLRLVGMTAQRNVSCILVTDAGKLPPVTGRDWTESIITAIIPTNISTRSGIHTSYSQVMSPKCSNKRKRLHQASSSRRDDLEEGRTTTIDAIDTKVNVDTDDLEEGRTTTSESAAEKISSLEIH